MASSKQLTFKTKVLFIHGTSISNSYSIFRGSDLKYGFFYGARNYIDSGEGKLFVWSPVAAKYSFLQSLFVYHPTENYAYERGYIQTDEAIERLENFLEGENFEVVITHSLGSYFLINYINKKGLPLGVTRIYTLASDAPRNLEISNQEVVQRFKAKNLIWENYHCFYDQALLGSVLANRKIPSGLLGTNSKFATNIYRPLGLKTFPNLHQEIVNDRDLIRKLVK